MANSTGDKWSNTAAYARTSSRVLSTRASGVNLVSVPHVSTRTLGSTWPRPTEFQPERRTIRGAALRRRRGKRWIQLRQMRATLRGFHSLSTRGPSCRCSCRTASTRLCVSVCSARHHSRQLHAPPRSHEEACVSVRYTSCLSVLHELSSVPETAAPVDAKKENREPQSWNN